MPPPNPDAPAVPDAHPHAALRARLRHFHAHNRVPNLIFNGPRGAGKRTLVSEFVRLLFQEHPDKLRQWTLVADCLRAPDVKTVREDLPFFAKTQPLHGLVKCVVLFHADRLSMDIQSVLRRCIELYSHHTRFFLVVEDKYKLLKPILSRFCELHVPLHLASVRPSGSGPKGAATETKSRTAWLRKELGQVLSPAGQNNQQALTETATRWYERGYSALDVARMLPDAETAVWFESMRYVVRHEKMLMLLLLQQALSVHRER